MWLGWVQAGLLLAPVWLDGGRHEGHRPDQGELTVAAAVVVTVAALVLGAVHGSRATRAVRDLPLVLVAAAGLAVLFLAANDALYRYVVPLPADLRGDGWSFPHVLLPVAAAALGFGAGLLRRRRPAAVPGRRWYVIAGACVLIGMYAVTGFVRAGAELATTRFHAGTPVPAGPVDLPAGRHAVLARYNDQPPTCTITGAGGEAVPVLQPSVEFTDNSDSVVTVLFGVFDLPAAGRVDIDCPRGEIAAPPQVRGPLGRLIFTPVAALLLAGAVPGALLALSVRASRRRRPAAARGIVPDE